MDISKLKVVELRKLAKDKKLRGYSKLKKQELVEFIEKNEKSENNNKKKSEKDEKKQVEQTFTLTFGNRAENHRGMQMIGKKLENGLSLEDLDKAKQYFKSKGNYYYDTKNTFIGFHGDSEREIVIAVRLGSQSTK